MDDTYKYATVYVTEKNKRLHINKRLHTVTDFPEKLLDTGDFSGLETAYLKKNLHFYGYDSTITVTKISYKAHDGRSITLISSKI